MQQRNYTLDGKGVSIIFSGEPSLYGIREVWMKGKRSKLTEKMKQELAKILS